MTKDDIIRMAREAGLFTHKDVQPEILAFANLVAAHKAEIVTAEAYRCGYEAGARAIEAAHGIKEQL
jgi:adenylyl- and sulfurtransferase ThiI